MNKKHIIFSIILLFLCIGSFKPFGCKNNITGIVTDQDGELLESATVTIGYFNPVITDAYGTYTIESVEYDDYTITVTCPGYKDKTSEISLSYLVNGLACADVAGTDIQLQIDYWHEIGGSATDDGIGISNSATPSLAMNNSGNLVVAWESGSSNSRDIYLKQWNGTSWEELGGSASMYGISNNPGDSKYPSLAINGSGNPIVAWQMEDLNDQIYLKQWNGTTWEELGGSATGGGISNSTCSAKSPSLAINGSGFPVVAWQNNTVSNYDEIYVKEWDGNNWVELGTESASGGGISNNINFSEKPSLAINGSGNPVVAWQDYTPGDAEIYIKQWNGSIWEEIGGSASGGGVSNNSGSSWDASLAVTGSSDITVVWCDNSSGNVEIYLKQWNGSNWVELGGSASGGGISNSTGKPECPVVIIDNSNNPIVAWQDNLSSDYDDEIYLKKWNGSNWVELGSSGSGDGLSDTDLVSSSPSLVINDLGNPAVVWHESTRIFGKQWEPGN